MINTPRTSLIKCTKMKVWPIESSMYTEGEFVGGNEKRKHGINDLFTI